MPAIKGILFDWNGTVLDDAEAVLMGANALFAAAGCRKISMQRFRDTFQVPLDRYIRQNGLDREKYLAHVKEFQDIFRKEYRKNVVHCRPREHIQELFEWLRQQKIRIGILSGDEEEDIRMNLKRHSLESYIDAIVAQGAIVTGGPQSKDVVKACRQLGVPKEHILIVGDTGQDIDTGREFNVPVVAMTGGYYTRERLRELAPDYLVDDVWEIKQIVEQYNAQHNGA